MYQQGNERDELRARFTKWMRVVAYRARRNYLVSISKTPPTVSLDELTEEHIKNRGDMEITEPPDEFSFEVEKLEKAFSQLPSVKKTVLIHLFVLEERPEEIAKKLGCTIQNVYNHRTLALKRLRSALKGENGHDR